MADEFDIGGLIGDFGGNPMGGGISSFLPSSSPALDPTAISGITGGGGGSWLDQLSGYANAALPVLRLGTAGLGAYTGIMGMQESAQQRKAVNQAEQTAQQAGAPGLAAAQQLIPAGTTGLMTGQLPPGLEAQVNNWTNAWRTQLHNYYAKAGISDSSMMAEADAMIASQAQELRAQLAQGLLTGGQGAAGVALQGAQIGGGLATQQGNQTNAAIQAANQALMRLLGSSS